MSRRQIFLLTVFLISFFFLSGCQNPFVTALLPDRNKPEQTTEPIEPIDNRATLIIKADDIEITLNDPVPDFTYTITGFVPDEDESVVSGEPEFSCEYEYGENGIGEYKITVTRGTLEADNYDFEYVDGTLFVKEPGNIIDNTINIDYEITFENLHDETSLLPWQITGDDPGEILALPHSGGSSITLTLDGFTNAEWNIISKEIQTTGTVFTLESEMFDRFDIGTHTLTVRVEVDGAIYSRTISFNVTERERDEDGI